MFLLEVCMQYFICLYFTNTWLFESTLSVKKHVLLRTSKWVLLMHFQVALCGVVKMGEYAHGKSTHFLDLS